MDCGSELLGKYISSNRLANPIIAMFLIFKSFSALIAELS